MQNMPIGIFRGDDTDAFSYQTIVGTINTDLDLTGCKAVFRYLGFSMEFDPIPEDRKLTIVIPADETKKFPPGLGYASLRVYDSEGRLRTFSNRIMVFVATKTPMFGSDEFEVDFNVRATLEPLKFFVGPNPDDFDEYRGYVEKVIDRASAEKYGLAILLDAIDSDLGANDGVAATPVAVKAAYATIINKLTDDYYTAEQTDEAIDRVAAYYITRNAAGDAFETKAQLNSATVFYSGGKVRVPTRNDYCVVLADESQGGAEYRYIYAVAEGQTTGGWQAQFPVEGVMTVDQTVTKDSTNPVSGGGVWSAIWGALASLPTGFTSLYDWCVAQLAGKVPTSRTVNGKALSSDVTLDADDVGALPAAHSENYYDLTNVGIDDLNLPSGTHVNGEVPILSGDVVAPDSSATSGKVADAEATYQALDGKQNALSAQQLANIAAVPNKANNADVVHKTGDETIAGNKKFTNKVLLSNWVSIYGHTQQKLILFRDEDLYLVTQLRPDGTPIVTEGSASFNAKLDSSSAAPAFSSDSSKNYSVGSYCTHDGKLYVCMIATSGGTWVANCWATSQLVKMPAIATTDNLVTFGNDTRLKDSGIAKENVALKGDIPYDLGTPIVINTASWETVEGETVYYGAATLANRTANIVQVTAATALNELRITFPAATSGKVRDFGLRVEIGTGSAALAAPALVPIAPTGETIKIENNAKEIPALADGTATAKGVTLLYFSENAPGVFVVKGEQVEEVA